MILKRCGTVLVFVHKMSGDKHMKSFSALIYRSIA
jgi:hypothetical protein